MTVKQLTVEASFPQGPGPRKVQSFRAPRKPMNSEVDYAAPDYRARPAVMALTQSSGLILCQWKRGRRISQIAKTFGVPRGAVEDLLRSEVVA